MAMAQSWCVISHLLKQVALPSIKLTSPTCFTIGKRHFTISQLLSNGVKQKNPKAVYNLNELYSAEVTEKLLQILNKSTEADLRAKGMAVGMIDNITKHRPFSQIEGLLNLPRVTPLMVKRMCNKLLREQDAVNRLLYPSLDPTFAQTIHTVTALNIATDASTYVTMECDGSFTSCGFIIMGRSGKRAHLFRYDHIAYIQEMKVLLEELPESNAYLMPQMQTYGNPTREILAIKYGRLLLENTFTSLIAGKGDGKQSVFYMPESRVSSAFDLTVGGEKVSCMDRLEQVLEGQYVNYQAQNVNPFRQQLARARYEQTRDQIGFLFLQCLLFISDDLRPLQAKLVDSL